jgi:hypothetical protein
MSAAKCETGWGDSLSTDTVPEWKDHPAPLALRAIDPPPPGEGKRPASRKTIYTYALTPTPMGQDTPVPPRPQ